MEPIKLPDFEGEAHNYSYDDRGGTRVMKEGSGAKLARIMYAQALLDLSKALFGNSQDGTVLDVLLVAKEVTKGL